MARDPLLGEKIIWQGRPQVVETPIAFRAAAAAWFVLAAISTCFGFAVALALEVSPVAQLLFAAWAASLGLACLHGPRIWFAKLEYIITDGHVIWRRGPFRRAISRRSISYARIFWNSDNPHVGDMELVRAVPTGALRRRLLLRFRGLAAPDKVWALVRGATSQSESNAGGRSLSQRLDQGERVLWSAKPRADLRRFMPQGRRRWQTVAIAATLVVGIAHLGIRMGANFHVLLEAGLLEHPGALAALIAGELLTAALVLGAATYLFYSAVIHPARQLAHTQYLITDRRVLIQRYLEELHLDRAQIVDVIEAPAMKGFRDVFLVLDGPQARALELSGAFGEAERSDHLKPIFESLMDAESVSRILLERSPASPPNAPTGDAQRPAA